MNNELTEAQKRLILEHAKLSVKFTDADIDTAKRLAEIEKELNMSPEKIASIVLSMYNNSYK